MTIVVITLALLIGAVPVLAHGLTLEAVEQASSLKLVLSGDNKLFHLENMAPGDHEQATFRIKNSYLESCRFYLRVDCESGSSDLLQQLELTVTDDGGTILYHGSMKSFDLIDLGSYARDDSHDFTLEICLPLETGNDYQGLSTSVKFTFIVEANGNGDNGDGNGNGNGNGDGDGDGDDNNGNSGGDNGNGGNGGGDGGRGGRSKPKPKPPGEIEVPLEKPPTGLPDIPAELEIQPPLELPPVEISLKPVPIGVTMPKTGEKAPYPYYLLGGLTLLAGTQLAGTRKRQ